MAIPMTGTAVTSATWVYKEPTQLQITTIKRFESKYRIKIDWANKTTRGACSACISSILQALYSNQLKVRTGQ